MKTATTLYPPAILFGRTRVADYLELAKPRVAVLVLFTVGAGAALAARGVPDLFTLIHTLLGTTLVVAGASALNQWLERSSDALMPRTENRPLPAGRLQPAEVVVLGFALGFGGVGYLAATVRQPLAALIAAIAFISYVFLYTPLKRKTTLNTLVGAVPGALPPVIGWTAVTGSIGPEVVVLFVTLYLWQVPHFLAIAWIYRDEYSRAGMRMLPVVDSQGAMTGRQMVLYCLTLIPISLIPAAQRMAGPIYLTGAVVLGLVFLGSAIAFVRCRSVSRARGVLRASLVYLPALLALLLIDGGLAQVAFAPWP
jgi:protoheme IX farnesyltransferase